MGRITLVGATGLVGNILSLKLVEAGHDLNIVGRRRAANIPDNIVQHLAPVEDWPEIVRQLHGDVAISCLGTTMKRAGSKEAFAAIDRDLVGEFAQAARRGGARQFIAISSVGADTDSGNFYLKTKGQAEKLLSITGFDRIDLMRPGLLRGKRDGDRRMGESIAVSLSPFTDLLMAGPLSRYRSTCPFKLSNAVVALTGAENAGRFIHENDAIARLGS